MLWIFAAFHKEDEQKKYLQQTLVLSLVPDAIFLQLQRICNYIYK